MRTSFVVFWLAAAPALALEPSEVVVIANGKVPASRGVAEHYLKRRGVPPANLFVAELTADETITRVDYDAQLAAPLRAFLKAKATPTKCLLTVHGVPLKVAVVEMTAAEQAEAAVVRPKRAALIKAIAELDKATPKDDKKLAALRAEEATLNGVEYRVTHYETNAAVDSELMLVLHPPYSLVRFLPNPLHREYQAPKDAPPGPAPVTLMTCRLDGPTPEIARRLVDDAVAVEAAGGLKGKAYVDARGIKFDAKKPGEDGAGYEGYDESFRETAALLKKAGLDVTLDDKDPVFAANACPDAALYTGWYSAATYVESCRFARGAVAWHLASYELGTMRGDNKLWVPNLLKAGAAVTLGPVGEPYTIGFPKPAEFFGLLATGNHTVAECYAKTVPVTSWMGALIGDPLYNPYRTSKPVKEADVPPSPVGVGFPLNK